MMNRVTIREAVRRETTVQYTAKAALMAWRCDGCKRVFEEAALICGLPVEAIQAAWDYVHEGVSG